MQLPALVFTQIFLSRMTFSLKRTQISSLANTSPLNSDLTHSNPSSGSNPASSGQQEKSTGSDSTLITESRKNSASEKSGLPSSGGSSIKKPTGPYDHSRRPSGQEGSPSPTYESHRRGSSVTLAPSPHPAGDYKFPNHSMSRFEEDIPPVPTPAQSVAIPPFATLPVRYQAHRAAYRNTPGGRFRRQTQSSDSDAVNVTVETEVDDSHQSEAGDRVLDIRTSYSQPPAVYPYLFEPPGTAASSLPPPTATSDVANRSSGEFEYLDEKAFRAARPPAQSPRSTPATTIGTSTATPTDSKPHLSS